MQMNSKYRIISKRFTLISLKIKMNIHRNKLSDDWLDALFPKTLHTDNSADVSVCWQGKVRAFLHGPRGLGRLCHVSILHNACRCDLEGVFIGVWWQNYQKNLGRPENDTGK